MSTAYTAGPGTTAVNTATVNLLNVPNGYIAGVDPRPVAIFTRGHILLNIPTVLQASQTVALAIIGIDAYGATYNYGGTFSTQSAAGQYLYVFNEQALTTASGGAIPASGIRQMPLPEQFQVQLQFANSTGSAAGISVSLLNNLSYIAE
ncbi:MAG TPA: hypothetical protein VKR58_05815 [Aquella sp.]|nr:hypothetical protein [Aquella sp.]